MSIYRTLTLTKREALLAIAKELRLDVYWMEKSKRSDNDIISSILFELTSKNPDTEYCDNNFHVID